MIKELINFTKNLDEGFKNLGVSPKEGLHIVLVLRDIDGTPEIDTQNYQYTIYSKKMIEESELLERCKFLSQNAWCIDTNKCFDLPTKAIHSCSPFLVAFKREHLKGGKKFKTNEKEKKKQVHERFAEYFTKAEALFPNEDSKNANQVFQLFFKRGDFNALLNEILEKNRNENQRLSAIKSELEQQVKDSKDKKEELKNEIKDVDSQLLEVKELEDSDYILFYLDKSLEEYKIVHQKYLADKLFNKDTFNLEIGENIHGVSGFFNSIDSGGNMPFLKHQTASFDITGRISDVDAKLLYDFGQILPRKILPNPLPIFIYQDEFIKDGKKETYVSLFKNDGFKKGYKEMIGELWESNNSNFENYYLLSWQNSKDGLVFQDFDFVSKFEYEVDNAQVENLFELSEKGKGLIHYLKINNVFAFEQAVFLKLIGVYNKEKNVYRVDYFIPLEGDDLKNIKKQYTNLNEKFIAYTKYRKAVYDYVFKSKRQGIDEHIFSDMVFSHIKDDLKQNNGYSIKEKLNIWFSLYEYFQPKNHKNEITMANQLKNYQEYVAQLSMNKADTTAMTDKQFAFAAGQIIEYILQKSIAENKSYQLLEPYLQQAKCQEFKRAIANDVARYKHAIDMEKKDFRFKNVCDAVLTHETDTNVKELMPEILAGVFSKCQFFHKDEEKTNN